MHAVEQAETHLFRVKASRRLLAGRFQNPELWLARIYLGTSLVSRWMDSKALCVTLRPGTQIGQAGEAGSLVKRMQASVIAGPTVLRCRRAV